VIAGLRERRPSPCHPIGKAIIKDEIKGRLFSIGNQYETSDLMVWKKRPRERMWVVYASSTVRYPEKNREM